MRIIFLTCIFFIVHEFIRWHGIERVYDLRRFVPVYRRYTAGKTGIIYYSIIVYLTWDEKKKRPNPYEI